MNNKQLDAMDLAKNGHSLFITGAIGTGKSQVLRGIIQLLEENGVCVAVTASTGLARQQITGIHDITRM